jgi:hypothetical protein
MPYPTPIVEIAFDDSPYVVNPTWTNVTSWVRSLSTDRGRSDDWDDFYGSAQVVLNNRTRLFDPYNTSGTYYGKLLPRRQIRIRAQTTDGGSPVTHDVFRGYISGWNPSWTDAGTDSTVTLSCMDALGLLSSDTLPDDWVNSYILSLNPRHYWKLNDPVPWYAGANFTVRDLGSAPSALNVLAASAYSDYSLASGITASSIGSQVYQGTLEQLTGGAPDVASDFTMCFWTKSTDTSDGFFDFCGVRVFFGLSGLFGGTKYSAQIIDTAGNNYSIESNVDYTANEPHHIAFTFNQTTKARTLYVDGFAIATTSGVSSTVPIFPSTEKFRFGSGSFQEVAIFPSILTLAQVQTIVRLSEATSQETTAARFTRLFTNTQFPAALTSAPSAPASAVLDLTPGGVKVSSELQKVADSEYAPLFVDRSGVVTLYNQNQIRTQTRSIVSQVTYGTGGADMGQDFQLMPDGDSMRNEASITMSGNGFYDQDNTASQTTYGVAQESLDTQVQTFANAIGIANIVTGWGGQVYPRLSPVQVVLDAANNWSPTMGLELNDRITVNAQPPSGGNAINVPMLVQNIKHSCEPGFWQTTLEGSARWAAVFILNKSTLGGTDLLG